MKEYLRPKPIAWGRVALLGYQGERLLMMCSADPAVVVESFIHDGLFEDDRSAEELAESIVSLRWELHNIDNAQMIFAAEYGDKSQVTEERGEMSGKCVKLAEQNQHQDQSSPLVNPCSVCKKREHGDMCLEFPFDCPGDPDDDE